MKRIFSSILVALLAVSLIAIAVPESSPIEVANAKYTAKDFGKDLKKGAKETWNFLSKGSGGTPTSFVEFKGGLQPPSGDGLAEELTQVKTARDFILNVTNFALSFLGVIAVLIVIYGGFLYVTSAGETEQTDKGKKAITYAGLGIIIVLISFAAVNTLILAPTGSDQPGGGTRSSAGIASNNSAQGRIFNLASLEVRSAIGTFIEAYDTLIEIEGQLFDLQQLPPPRAVSEIRSFLTTVERSMNTIKRVSDRGNKAYAAADSVLDEFVRPWNALSNDDLESVLVISGGDTASLLKILGTEVAYAQSPLKSFYEEGSGAFHSAFADTLDEYFYNADPQKEDFQNAVQDIIYRIGLVEDGLGPIASAPAESAIDRGITSEEDLQMAFAGIPPGFTIKEAFKDATDNLKESKDTLSRTPEDIVLAEETIDSLARLFVLVQDIKFMAVQINANIVEGSAPLSVLFTSIGSLDPSGATIEDSQHEWDLDGNGTNDTVNSLGCNEAKRASVSCTYVKPGTYRVSLRVNPKQGSTQTASGIAVFTIKVNPPTSKINLVAATGELKEELYAFNEDGELVTSETAFSLTLDEAKVGVKYDASASTDASGDPNGISNFEWNFGDTSNVISGPNARAIDNPKKSYANIGSFPLRLEVTDNFGNKDRAIVNINVASIASRITNKLEHGDLNTLFEFDGSFSKSDVGQITFYEWTVLDTEGAKIDIANNTSDTFRHQFKNPGTYTVRLVVSDEAGDSATDETTITVESRPPVAQFEVEGCVVEGKECIDPSQPSIVVLDATKSFDPDEGDEIEYRWSIVGAKESEYELIDNSSLKGSGEDAKRVVIKFKKPGKYTIRLDVTDQHGNPNLRKAATTEKEISIASAVDLAWSVKQETAMNLDEEAGLAAFTFEAFSSNADEFDIDYGDGGNGDEGVRVTNKIINSKHGYGKAGSYTVTITARSEKFGTTIIQRRFYVGNGNSPIPVIRLIKENNQEIFFNDSKPVNILARVDRITFDASGSVSSKGDRSKLKYSWSFGDGEGSTKSTAKHTYNFISPEKPGYFEATLTILEEDDSGDVKTSKRSVLINAQGAKPELFALSVAKLSSGSKAPLDFEVVAEGAKDPDGNITEYTFWYYDENDEVRRLSPMTTKQPQAILTIGTKGAADEEKKYAFCVEIKDNENNISTCEDLFPNEKQRPFVNVTNGPNESPTVDITANRTSANVGESITFSAEAEDPDGRVVEYVWDLLGDGFHNDTATELPQITQVYEEESTKRGFQIQVKVIDDQGAEGFSEILPVYIDSPFPPPRADFGFTPIGDATVQFEDDSKTLDKNIRIESYLWDFDLSKEFCTETVATCSKRVCDAEPLLCDHDPSNDPDSRIKNPQFEYPSSGDYEVRLIIEDENGQKDDAIKFVQIRRGQTANPNQAKAILRVSKIDGKETQPDAQKIYHLKGNGQKVTFYVGDSRGNIVDYSIDGNILYDSNSVVGGGDGAVDNDVDFGTTDGSETVTIPYANPATNPGFITQKVALDINGDGVAELVYAIIARLTITTVTPGGQIVADSTCNNISRHENDQNPPCDPEHLDAIFVFDPPTGAASLFLGLGATQRILLILVGTTILIVLGSTGISLLRRGKTRITK